MSKSNALILVDIRLKHPQFAGVDDARLTCFIEEARNVWVSQYACRLSGYRLDQAITYKALSLLQASLSSSSSGATGGVKKEKTRNVEIEYFGNSGSSGGQTPSNDFEGLYQQIIRSVGRSSPRVLGSRYGYKNC